MTRHAAATAHRRWLERLYTVVAKGTPHHGSLLERRGNRGGLLLGDDPLLRVSGLGAFSRRAA